MECLAHYSPHQLYDRIESLITTRSIYGRGKSQEAYHCRSVINPEIKRLRRELNRRKLPSRRWLYEAQQQAADIADLHDTQKCAL